MKSTLKTLALLVGLGASAAFAVAQPALKVAVVNLAQVYDDHYRTQEQNAKLEVDRTKAQEEFERLTKEGNSLVDEFRERVDQAKNPALTEDARKKAEAEARSKDEEIRAKQNELRNFQTNTQRSLQQRIQNFRQVMLEEISKQAVEIAKKKGATLLVDKSGPSLIGVPAVIYFDPAYDITEELMAEINKTRPANMPPPPARTSSTPSALAPADGAPMITVPGVAPKP